MFKTQIIKSVTIAGAALVLSAGCGALPDETSEGEPTETITRAIDKAALKDAKLEAAKRLSNVFLSPEEPFLDSSSHVRLDLFGEAATPQVAALTSSDTDVATVPASSPGFTSSIWLPVTLKKAGCTFIGASLGETTLRRRLLVHPESSPTTKVDAPSLGLAGGSDQGRVRLRLPNAGPFPLAVQLVSSNPSVSSVPNYVLIPVGATSASFTITHNALGCAVITTGTGAGATGRTIKVGEVVSGGEGGVIGWD